VTSRRNRTANHIRLRFGGKKDDSGVRKSPADFLTRLDAVTVGMTGFYEDDIRLARMDKREDIFRRSRHSGDLNLAVLLQQISDLFAHMGTTLHDDHADRCASFVDRELSE